MDQLLAMGFPEEAAKAALEAHGHDVARSLDALLNSAEPVSTHSTSPEVNSPGRNQHRSYALYGIFETMGSNISQTLA